jgi:hypothetical protein
MKRVAFGEVQARVKTMRAFGLLVAALKNRNVFVPYLRGFSRYRAAESKPRIAASDQTGRFSPKTL